MIIRSQTSIPPDLPKPPPNPNKNPKNLTLQTLTPFKTLSIPSSPPLLLLRSSSDAGLRFRQKLLHLETLGVDTDKALSANPDLRSAPLASVLSVERFLRSSAGVLRSDVGRIFGMHPRLLTCDPRSDILPVVDFLVSDAGVPRRDLRKAIVRCPRLLVSSVPDQLRPTLYFLRRLGFVGAHAIDCSTTLLLVSSVEETLLPKLEYLRGLGFTRREAAKMVLRSPGLLTFSIEKNFRPKVEYLIGEMGKDVAEVGRFPQYFSFSLEGKIKPRHRKLVEVGLFEEVSLKEMLRVSDGEFSDRLVEMRLRSVDEVYSQKGTH
ncbi:hypothetical protein QJS10_CPA09g01533 [Acorus calamus]|uniref:Uncharacterized protein n=1 Tax=Acorus calamus TaxID=4465 RepID=A0AAV9E7Z4_ACOCL|nr:hypothetical protein QJS10_CPA09g01533 [Acorus calamus]